MALSAVSCASVHPTQQEMNIIGAHATALPEYQDLMKLSHTNAPLFSFSLADQELRNEQFMTRILTGQVPVTNKEMKSSDSARNEEIVQTAKKTEKEIWGATVLKLEEAITDVNEQVKVVNNDQKLAKKLGDNLKIVLERQQTHLSILKKQLEEAKEKAALAPSATQPSTTTKPAAEPVANDQKLLDSRDASWNLEFASAVLGEESARTEILKAQAPVLAEKAAREAQAALPVTTAEIWHTTVLKLEAAVANVNEQVKVINNNPALTKNLAETQARLAQRQKDSNLGRFNQIMDEAFDDGLSRV